LKINFICPDRFKNHPTGVSKDNLGKFASTLKLTLIIQLKTTMSTQILLFSKSKRLRLSCHTCTNVLKENVDLLFKIETFDHKNNEFDDL